MVILQAVVVVAAAFVVVPYRTTGGQLSSS
jgi:hypothetical protein